MVAFADRPFEGAQESREAARLAVMSQRLLARELDRVPLVVDAEVFVDFAARGAIVVGVLPRNGPAAAPGPRLRTLVVDGHLILHRVEVGAREPFDEVHVAGVRQTTADEPELLVETDGIHDQRVALPVPD